MNNILLETDCAKDILGTYQKVKDHTLGVNTVPMRHSIQQRCQDLEQELNELKDQYKLLQQDFEHALRQMKMNKNGI